MDPESSRKGRPDRGGPVFLGLLALLAALNLTALAGMLSARQAVREAAREELQLQTQAHAQALRAALATLRGDLLFLSQSPPLARAMRLLEGNDPVARRWARLDLEGSALLFLEAHPPVRALLVRDPSGVPLVAAGRREGAPVLLPPNAGAAAGPRSGLERSTWEMRGPDSAPAGNIESWVDPAALLAATAPGLDGRLTVGFRTIPLPDALPAGFVAEVPVADDAWNPAVRWRLRRAEPEARLLGSVEAMAARFRRTALLNAAMIVLALPLGVVALNQARRAARLQAERRHQERVRLLERRVEQKERLVALGRMAAGIAHEVNNPLEGMANYLTVLQDDLRAGDVDAALAAANRVRAGLDRAAGITRQALTLASGDRGRDPLDLRDVVRRTVEFARHDPSGSDLRWRVDLPDAPLHVRAHAGQIDQVLLNLLRNACLAQPGGGEVVVVCAPEGARAVLHVEDHGPGLAPEARARLFEPFHSTRGSAGLGLAVSHAIVTEHGGTLEAGDRVGGGARFTVTLPLAPEEIRETAT